MIGRVLYGTWPKLVFTKSRNSCGDLHYNRNLTIGNLSMMGTSLYQPLLLGAHGS